MTLIIFPNAESNNSMEQHFLSLELVDRSDLINLNQLLCKIQLQFPLTQLHRIKMYVKLILRLIEKLIGPETWVSRVSFASRSCAHAHVISLLCNRPALTCRFLIIKLRFECNTRKLCL